MINKNKLLKSKSEDYLNQAQLVFFARLLEAEKQRVMIDIRNSREVLEDNPLEPDILDLSVREEVKDSVLKRVEGATLLLHEIEGALNRIHNNTYGYCALTGEPIGIPRLLAQPMAALSVSAKLAQEEKKRVDGGF